LETVQNTDMPLLLHPFNGLFSRTSWVSRHQKGKPFWILLEQEMMWQGHQLDNMQIICTSLQTNNHTSTSPLSFLQAGWASCHPTNSDKALKVKTETWYNEIPVNHHIIHFSYDVRSNKQEMVRKWSGNGTLCIFLTVATELQD